MHQYENKIFLQEECLGWLHQIMIHLYSRVLQTLSQPQKIVWTQMQSEHEFLVQQHFSSMT